MTQTFNTRVVKAALQARAMSLQMEFNTAQEAVRLARDALTKVKAAEKAVLCKIIDFEKEFAVKLRDLLADHRPSLLRNEVDAAIAEFRKSSLEMTLTDLRGVLMARGKLSAEEINSSRVRSYVARLTKHGVLKRHTIKRGVYQVVRKRAKKARLVRQE